MISPLLAVACGQTGPDPCPVYSTQQEQGETRVAWLERVVEQRGPWSWQDARHDPPMRCFERHRPNIEWFMTGSGWVANPPLEFVADLVGRDALLACIDQLDDEDPEGVACHIEVSACMAVSVTVSGHVMLTLDPTACVDAETMNDGNWAPRSDHPYVIRPGQGGSYP